MIKYFGMKKNFKTLVFGASLNPLRYSYLAMQRLNKYGYSVEAIGGTAGVVGDIEVMTGYPALKDIHTITMYMNPEKQKVHYEYLLSLQPRRIIFNPGAENDEFANLAELKGIEVVNNCTLVMLSLDRFDIAA